MKIVIAHEKIKGRLAAPEACQVVRRSLPDMQVIVKPTADGGDGTADVRHAALGGEWFTLCVTGPLPKTKVTARWPGQKRCAEESIAMGLGCLVLFTI
jgi:glycerate kinase